MMFVDGSNFYHAVNSRYVRATVEFNRLVTDLVRPERERVRVYCQGTHQQDHNPPHPLNGPTGSEDNSCGQARTFPFFVGDALYRLVSPPGYLHGSFEPVVEGAAVRDCHNSAASGRENWPALHYPQGSIL